MTGPTDPPTRPGTPGSDLQADVLELRSGVRAATARLTVVLDDLTDASARSPSALPDWSRGHVATHLARNADGLTRLVDGAARGTRGVQYPGGSAARAADIAAGANRAAAVLRADIVESAERLERAWDALDDDTWTVIVDGHAGGPHPAWYTTWRRWREVEIHTVDLGLDFAPADWSPAFVERALAAERTRLADALGNDLVVAGDDTALLAWLIGRTDGTGLRVTRQGVPIPLPLLPAWG